MKQQQPMPNYMPDNDYDDESQLHEELRSEDKYLRVIIDELILTTTLCSICAPFKFIIKVIFVCL